MPSVVHLDTSRTWRGGQLQVFLLHRELIAMGVSSELVASRGGALHLRCVESGLPIDPVGHLRAWNPMAVAAIWRRTRGAEIVHAHDSHAVTLAAIVRAADPGLALVCHRRIAYPPKRGLNRRLKYRRVDRWIAVSREISENMKRAGATRLRVVPSAVDVDGLFRRASKGAPDRLRQQLAIESGRPVVALVGALVPQKDHDTLIDSAPAILTAAPETVFLCVGEGPLRRRLERRVHQAGMERSFRFTGFRRDVEAVIGMSTVIAVPSLDGEGSSAVIKEAMVLGTPVVVSDLPGNLEVAGSKAVSFPAGNPGGLARAVARLIGRPEDEKPSGRHPQQWLPTTMATGVLAAYEGLEIRGTVLSESV
jgi:glycosyltransferase involved in cell wall biosynthesis